MLKHLNASPENPSRVVVMGATGFVGGALVAALIADGIDILPLGRSDVDLMSPDAAEKLAKVLQPNDAFVAVSAKAPAKNAEMMIENIIMARAIADALKVSPVSHVVNISSDAVYVDEPTPLNEASCTAPDSYHGMMHLAREVMLKNEIKAPLTILRPTLIYGLDDPHNGYGPNKFRRLAQSQEDIVLFGEGEERRDHVHIDDVAAIICLVLKWKSSGTLNIATGHVASFRQIAEMVVSYSKNPVEILVSPRSGPMPHNGYRPFDIANSQRAFPEFHFRTLKEALPLLVRNQ